MHEGIPNEIPIEAEVSDVERGPFTESFAHFSEGEANLAEHGNSKLKLAAAGALALMTSACTGMHVEYKSSFESRPAVTHYKENPNYIPGRTTRINLAPVLRKAFGGGNQRHSALEQEYQDGTQVEHTVLASDDGGEATEKIVVKRVGMPDMVLDLAAFV